MIKHLGPLPSGTDPLSEPPPESIALKPDGNAFPMDGISPMIVISFEGDGDNIEL
jgi:hypothetical protein